MIIIILIWTGVIIYAGIIAAKKIKEKRETNEAEQAKERWFELNPPKSRTFPVRKYEKKKLMTQTELQYFRVIRDNTPAGYVPLPQINLAAIINRIDEHKYQNELFRNIDFVIFDLKTNPIVLIEINDGTHLKQERIIRDKNIKYVCDKAGLPIITFWTQYGIDPDYIKRRIEEYCKPSA